jgi:hypothetical protein
VHRVDRHRPRPHRAGKADQPHAGDLAGRLTLRGPDGGFIGEIRLTLTDIETLTLAATAVGDAANCTEETSRPDGETYAEEFTRVQQAAEREQAARETDCRIDPALADEFEQYCVGLPVDLLLDMDPAEAVAAFDQVTSDMDDNEPGGSL